MKRITFFLALLAAGWGKVHAAPASTNSAPADRILMIDPSSMWIGGGQATLTVGPLQRTNGIYTGNYKLKVIPYFYKNEKGRLAIAVSDATLAEVNHGKVVALTGTATTSGKGGICRPIVATATAADINHGTLKVCFTAGKRKMIFLPAYHLADNETTAVVAQAAEIKP